jgi:hypothetical protein
MADFAAKEGMSVGLQTSHSLAKHSDAKLA